jgi:hypothetical protein
MELHNTMKAFVHSRDKASWRMLQLTWAIMGLTAAMLCAVGIQITIGLR